jgi:hypothetical protein
MRKAMQPIPSAETTGPFLPNVLIVISVIADALFKYTRALVQAIHGRLSLHITFNVKCKFNQCQQEL